MGEGERVEYWGYGRGQGSRVLGGSALELLEARLTHTHWFLGGRRQGVLGRALGAEDVAAVPAVVLGGDREGGRGRLEEQEATLFHRR